MKKTLSIVMLVVLVFVAVACSPENHKHTWDEGKQTLAPSCTTTGEITFTCTTCGETKTETVAALGHSHAKNAVKREEQSLNCVQDGIYTYRCQVCGAEFQEIVTPKEAAEAGIKVPHAVLKNGAYVNYLTADGKINTGDEISEDDAHYEKDKTVAATEFTPVSYEAYCASCLEPLGYLNKPVETSETTAPTYKNMVGTLICYTLDSSGNITYIVYGDIVENTEGLTVKKIESSYTAGEGWTTTNASNVTKAEFVERYDCEDTKERALKLDNTFYLSKDSTGAWVVSSDNSSDEYSTAESKTCKIVFIENHNHLYGTSSAENDKSTFIGNDSNFKLMSFMSNNLMDETNHYVYCDECGLKYYPVAHIYDTSTERTDEQKATCTKCGYYAKNYCEVTVNKSSDPVAMTTANNALEAAKTAWKYGGSGSAFTTSTTGTDAATEMQKVADALKAADEILKKMGKTDDSGARSAIKTLLTVNSVAAPRTSIADAIKAATASGSTTLDGTAVENYKAVLLSAENALIGIQTDTSSTTVEGITKSENGSVVAEIKYWVNETSVEADSFVVKKGVILDLDYDEYTTSRGVSYSFAENTGWLIGDNEAIQLTADGFKILEDGTLSFFETL